MNILKTFILAVLLVSLVVGCSKPEEKKVSGEAVTKSLKNNQTSAKAEANKISAEAAASAKAEANKIAEEAAASAKAEANKIAAEAAASAKAEADKIAAEAAASAKAEADKLALAASAKAEANKIAAEAAASAKAEADKLALAASAKAEANKIAEEAAASAKAEADKIAADAAAISKEKLEKIAVQSSIPVFDLSSVNLGDKTPVGAQKSGNAAGTIPAWTGGITKPPAGYRQGDHHQDPFSGDKILFTINSSNHKEYEEYLSVGQKGMFDKYDSYKMHVYQSRRSASFPERIYQKTIENGKTGKLIAGGEGVTGVAEGFPFPNAKNAYELILNHKLKYKGSGGVRYNNQVAPTATGRYTVVKLKEELLGKYYTEGNTIEDLNNILLYFFQVVESPARLAGRILLVHETMNQTETPRQAWIYNPGQRRVRRAPNVAYDNPGTASDGLRTNDMTDMFNGAMDRFNWKVVGKKEMYVPYNSYKVHSGDLEYSDIVRPGHLNVDLMRYELHRMYVVEATLKEGVRHINSRRTYYLDEDSYQIMLTDHYDKRGNIWRFSEAHSINYYDVPTFWSTIETHHDLRSGRYVAVGLDNKDPINTFNVPLSEANYTPQALRKRGRR